MFLKLLVRRLCDPRKDRRDPLLLFAKTSRRDSVLVLRRMRGLLRGLRLSIMGTTAAGRSRTPMLLSNGWGISSKEVEKLFELKSALGSRSNTSVPKASWMGLRKDACRCIRSAALRPRELARRTRGDKRLLGDIPVLLRRSDRMFLEAEWVLLRLRSFIFVGYWSTGY